MPKWIINSLAYFGDIIKAPLNSHRLNKLTENYVVSNRKIKKELNVELPISSSEGMRKTIRSFK